MSLVLLPLVLFFVKSLINNEYMEYIAELNRRLSHSDLPLGTLGGLFVYRLDSTTLEPYGEPIFHCFSLEPIIPVVPGGCHNISITYSPRFSPKLPYRKYRGVPLISSPSCPERRGIRIHIGNSVNDTRGCILLGTDYNQDGLLNSRAAFVEFMKYASHINKINIYESY